MPSANWSDRHPTGQAACKVYAIHMRWCPKDSIEKQVQHDVLKIIFKIFSLRTIGLQGAGALPLPCINDLMIVEG